MLRLKLCFFIPLNSVLVINIIQKWQAASYIGLRERCEPKPTLSQSKALVKPNNKENMNEESTPYAGVNSPRQLFVQCYFVEFTRFYFLNFGVSTRAQVSLVTLYLQI